MIARTNARNASVSQPGDSMTHHGDIDHLGRKGRDQGRLRIVVEEDENVVEGPDDDGLLLERADEIGTQQHHRHHDQNETEPAEDDHRNVPLVAPWRNHARTIACEMFTLPLRRRSPPSQSRARKTDRKRRTDDGKNTPSRQGEDPGQPDRKPCRKGHQQRFGIGPVEREYPAERADRADAAVLDAADLVGAEKHQRVQQQSDAQPGGGRRRASASPAPRLPAIARAAVPSCLRRRSPCRSPDRPPSSTAGPCRGRRCRSASPSPCRLP